MRIIRTILFCSLIPIWKGCAFNNVGPISSISSNRISNSQIGMIDLDPETVSSSIVQAGLLPTGFIHEIREGLCEASKQGGAPAMALIVALSDTIPFLPTQPIAILAGIIFGFKFGLPAVIIGQAMATIFALLFGREVLAKSEWSVFDSTEPTDNNKMMKVLDELTVGLNTGDFKTVFGTIVLARQSPVMPFSLGNYFIGAATEAPLVPVITGTIVGCLPINVALVGAGVGGMKALDIVKENGIFAEGLEAFGAVVTLGFIAVVVKTISSVYTEEDSKLSES